MKRYWAAAVFAAFIVLTIGTYYVKASYDRLPQFRLTTLEGDAGEAHRLLLNGNLRTDLYGESVLISDSGSRYDSERSLWERIHNDSRYYDPAIKRLVREHPNLMRGAPFSSEYYEDGDWLVRVKLHEQRLRAAPPMVSGFGVDILDKKTKRTGSFNATLAVGTPQHRFLMLDVQRAGNALRIAVLKFGEATDKSGVPESSELHVYDVDTAAGKITADHLIPYAPPSGAGHGFHLGNISQQARTQPCPYLVLLAAGTGDREASELAVYSYDTGKMDMLPLPADSGNTERQLLQDGEQLLLLQPQGTELLLRTYNLADPQKVREIRVQRKDLGADSVQQMVLGRNRLYVLTNGAKAAHVAVIDASNGRVVYRGNVTAASAGQASLGNLEVYSLLLSE